MRSNSTAKVQIDAEVIRGGGILQNNTLASSVWEVEHWRDGKLLSKTQDKNLVTNQGLNRILDVMFHATTQTTTWYVALVESDTTATSAMTHAVPVYTECTTYSEVARQAYAEAAASGKSMTNSANKATFTMSGTKTLYGASLNSIQAKGSTVSANGWLYCYSKFSEAKDVENGDTVKVTITLSQAAA